MKKIYTFLSEYLRTELKIKYLFCLLIFLLPVVTVNYYYNFENNILASYKSQAYYFLMCLLYYGFVYWYAVLLYLFLYKKIHLLKELRFLLLILLFPSILAFDESFTWHKLWVAEIEDHNLKYYVKNTLNHAIMFITYFLPIVFYYFFLERENKNFYGLAPSKWDIKPYLFMLFVIMMPLICMASFLPSFQESYPIYAFSKIKDDLPGEYWQQILLFEGVYGLDFVYVELLFRGIMIHTMYRYMGYECILAMATLYCTYHFGKPLGETLSSFVGGTVLGILSLRTRSLYGGIIIHIGIAWMMDATSLLQKIFR